MVQVTREDVKPLVDQMIRLLEQPRRRSRLQRPVAWFSDSAEREAKDRADMLSLFRDIRSRLDEPTASFEDEAHHLVRWMDWEGGIERHPDDIRSLAPKIQHALELLERSGRRSRR